MKQIRQKFRKNKQANVLLLGGGTFVSIIIMGCIFLSSMMVGGGEQHIEQDVVIKQVENTSKSIIDNINGIEEFCADKSENNSLQVSQLSANNSKSCFSPFEERAVEEYGLKYGLTWKVLLFWLFLLAIGIGRFIFTINEFLSPWLIRKYILMRYFGIFKIKSMERIDF